MYAVLIRKTYNKNPNITGFWRRIRKRNYTGDQFRENIRYIESSYTEFYMKIMLGFSESRLTKIKFD